MTNEEEIITFEGHPVEVLLLFSPEEKRTHWYPGSPAFVEFNQAWWLNPLTLRRVQELDEESIEHFNEGYKVEILESLNYV